MSHQRSPEEMARVRAKALRLWDTEPELTATAISQRLGLSLALVLAELRQAFVDGRTKRSTSRPPSTRLSRQGRA